MKGDFSRTQILSTYNLKQLCCVLKLYSEMIASFIIAKPICFTDYVGLNTQLFDFDDFFKTLFRTCLFLQQSSQKGSDRLQLNTRAKKKKITLTFITTTLLLTHLRPFSMNCTYGKNYTIHKPVKPSWPFCVIYRKAYSITVVINKFMKSQRDILLRAVALMWTYSTKWRKTK